MEHCQNLPVAAQTCMQRKSFFPGENQGFCTRNLWHPFDGIDHTLEISGFNLIYLSLNCLRWTHLGTKAVKDLLQRGITLKTLPRKVCISKLLVNLSLFWVSGYSLHITFSVVLNSALSLEFKNMELNPNPQQNPIPSSQPTGFVNTH